eukprot:UN07850
MTPYFTKRQICQYIHVDHYFVSFSLIQSHLNLILYNIIVCIHTFISQQYHYLTRNTRKSYNQKEQ